MKSSMHNSISPGKGFSPSPSPNKRLGAFGSNDMRKKNDSFGGGFDLRSVGGQSNAANSMIFKPTAMKASFGGETSMATAAPASKGAPTANDLQKLGGRKASSRRGTSVGERSMTERSGKSDSYDKMDIEQLEVLIREQDVIIW